MSQNLTQADLVAGIARATGVTGADVATVLNALGGSIRAAAQDGQTVLTPFGRFVPKARAARMGRNPRTGEAVEIAAKTTVSFKMAKTKT